MNYARSDFFVSGLGRGKICDSNHSLVARTFMVQGHGCMPVLLCPLHWIGNKLLLFLYASALAKSFVRENIILILHGLLEHPISHGGGAYLSNYLSRKSDTQDNDFLDEYRLSP